jgi:spore germination cell wall hydrolase CwlJ-like protein
LTHPPAAYAGPERRKRVVRRARPLALRGAGAHRGRRLLALCAAIAVPAMAAPGEWNGFGPAAPAAARVEPMPFETPGESFPGSAFFYLADLPQAPAASDGALPPPLETGAHPEGMASPAGATARSFRLAGSGMDKARALQCLTMAVYYEAASESVDGQRAVAQVVLNRVAHPSYPDSVCGVVFQGSERQTGCQFTFTCDGSLNRRPMAAAWDRARAVAARALAGDVYAPVGLATHYHTIFVHPYWDASLDNVGTIGLHTFFRWRGAAGQPAAFVAAYRGGEPVAAPHPRVANPSPESAPDPVVLAQAFEAARRTAAAQAAALAPPPVYAPAVAARGGEKLFAADNLPASAGVKPEYANAGRWIAQPH